MLDDLLERYPLHARHVVRTPERRVALAARHLRDERRDVRGVREAERSGPARGEVRGHHHGAEDVDALDPHLVPPQAVRPVAGADDVGESNRQPRNRHEVVVVNVVVVVTVVVALALAVVAVVVAFVAPRRRVVARARAQIRRLLPITRRASIHPPSRRDLGQNFLAPELVMPVPIPPGERLRRGRVDRAPRVFLANAAAVRQRVQPVPAVPFPVVRLLLPLPRALARAFVAHLVHGIRRHEHVPPRPPLQTSQRRSQIPRREAAEVDDDVPRAVRAERGARRDVHRVRERARSFPIAHDVRHLVFGPRVPGVAPEGFDVIASCVEVVNWWVNRVGIAEPLAAPSVDRGDGVTVADESPDDVRADEAVAAEDQGVTVVGHRRADAGRRRRLDWMGSIVRSPARSGTEDGCVRVRIRTFRDGYPRSTRSRSSARDEDERWRCSPFRATASRHRTPRVACGGAASGSRGGQRQLRRPKRQRSAPSPWSRR